MARVKIQVFGKGGWWIQYFDKMDDARKMAIWMIENTSFGLIPISRGTKLLGYVEKNKYGPGYTYNRDPINKNGTMKR